MVNSENLKNFFERNGVRHGKNITSLKNLYLIFEIISNEKTFNSFINGEAGNVRNPYKNVYSIKPGKNFVHNMATRAVGTMKINKVNNQAKMDYCKSVIMSAIIFHKMGYRFSKEEKDRIRKCYSLIYSSQKRSNRNINQLTDTIGSLYGKEQEPIFPLDSFREGIQNIMDNKGASKDECKIYRNNLLKVLNMLNDDEKTKKFIHDVVAGDYPDEIQALNELVNLICLGKVNFNEKININCSKCQYIAHLIDKKVTSSEDVDYSYDFTHMCYSDEENRRRKEEYDIIIDKILKKSMEESKSSGKNLALCLYNNLNESLLYNTMAFSWSQDNDEIEKLINGDKANDINFNKQEVTCHTWSSAMLDLFTRAGYEAYLVGDRGHQFVMFFDENNNACIADGTNPPEGKNPNWLKAADITRSKLGLMPNNMFQILGRDEYLQPEQLYYSHGKMMKSNDIAKKQQERKDNIKLNINEFKKKDGTYDYKAMFKFIDENPSTMESIKKMLKRKNTENKMVEFLNEVLKCLTEGHEDDDLLLYNCVSNLVYALTKGEGSTIKDCIEFLGIKPAYSMGDSHDLYKKVGDRTKFVPLIYIKQKNGVKYYIWDEAGKFEEISKQDLLDKINSGEYHSSKNNDSKQPLENRYVIPGIKSPRKKLEDEEEAIFGKKSSNNIDEFGWVEVE